jgi:hypothetical protein
MNSLEVAALREPISNEARVLYCIYLRPNFDYEAQSTTVNNKDILSLLNAQRTCLSLGREVSALFKELNDVGLIALKRDNPQETIGSSNNEEFSRSLNKRQVTLPLFQADISALDLGDDSAHLQHHKIMVTWRPDEALFKQICQLVGVIESYFDADELGEFIAYWLGRPEVQNTPYQWTQKFVLHLKQRRMRKPLQADKSKVGHQWVAPTASIEFDDNVKQLIKKYSEQS